MSNTQRLLRESGLQVTSAELDRYLWIRGAYAAWLKNQKAPLNADLKRFFEEHSKDPHLQALVG